MVPGKKMLCYQLSCLLFPKGDSLPCYWSYHLDASTYRLGASIFFLGH